MSDNEPKFPRVYQEEDPVVRQAVPEVPIENYVGDAVYAIWDGHGIKLDVDRYSALRREVYLEPEVLRALDHFRATLRERGFRGV